MSLILGGRNIDDSWLVAYGFVACYESSVGKSTVGKLSVGFYGNRSQI